LAKCRGKNKAPFSLKARLWAAHRRVFAKGSTGRFGPFISGAFGLLRKAILPAKSKAFALPLPAQIL
jgi:hypothetical protein